jgi:putative methyltransferase (TIGR04325 family)
MKLKSLIKQLIPPIMLKIFNFSSKKQLQPTFSNFKEALANAGSYEDEVLIKVIVAKTLKFIEEFEMNSTISFENLSNSRTVRTLLAVISGVNKKTNELTVLDFGGSAGVHYFTARQILNSNIKLNWLIVETQSMVQEAKASGLENDELKFFASIKEAKDNYKTFDVVYSNYALCYTPNPLDYLSQLLKLNFKILYITNTALNENNEEVTGLQSSFLSTNGIGREIPTHLNIKDKKIQYPFVIPSKKIFENLIIKYGEIISVIKESSSTYYTDKGNFDNYGYFVKKIN